MTTDAPPTENIAQTLRDIIHCTGHHQEIHPGFDQPFNPTDVRLITTPQQRRVDDLTATYRAAAQVLKPWLRKGTARLATLESLIAWANRNKGETSVLYAHPDQAAPSLTCIANYHSAGPASLDGLTPDATAQRCDHRGVYAFPVSKEWQRWTKISGQPMDKDEMGQFIDDNAKDFYPVPPSLLNPGTVEPHDAVEERLLEVAEKIGGRFGQHLKLVEMARVFQVHEVSNLAVTSNRDSGESTISFVNEHRDTDGRPLSIPNLFLIAIPVFESGVPYRLPVRFQYRKTGSAIKFTLTVYDPQRAFDDAFNEAVNHAAIATDLPLFAGQPET